MQNVLLIYGGRSYEHDVSVISAVQIGELWNSEYRVIPLYLRQGELYVLKDWRRYTSYTGALKGKKAAFAKGGIRLGGRYIPVLAAVLATHGGEGEDGTLAALLHYYDIPCTAADATSSGICMDKVLCKEVLAAKGFVVLEGGEAEEGTVPPLPAVCKPARLGSSIGVRVAYDAEQWHDAYSHATVYDRKVLWERYLAGAKEYNCAVVADGEKLLVSAVERPAYVGDTYTFGDKYKRECAHELPADVPTELYAEIQDTTQRVYRALGLWGVVRVDYLWAEGKLYVNEINTIPGSLSFRLFSAAGVPLNRLMQVLVRNARLAPSPKVEYGKLLGELVGTYK